MKVWREIQLRYRLATVSKRALPDFLIIGAQRSGTSTLYQHLARHPHVAPAFRKEVHFFDRNFDKGLDWYRAQFPVRDEFVTGEASPSYLFSPEVPARVEATLPEVKLIAILRNPIDRAYSAYQRWVRQGRETRSFAEAMDGTQPPFAARGHYAEQLEIWLKRFPRERLLVLSAEAFFKEPVPSLNHACRFLGIPPYDRLSPDALKWVQQKYSYDRYEGMDPAARLKWAEHYRPHNERLYRLIGEDFGWSG